MDASATDKKSAEKIAKKTRDEKLREQKIETEILKSLNGIDGDQKFQTLLKRCVEAERVSKSHQLLNKQNQKTIETLLQEKDNLQAEYNRVVLTKSKLESLCRELQNQNKTIKEDSLSQIKQEEERRKETQAKFQKSLNEIQKLMTENSEKNLKLEQDNQGLSQKFKTILTQYEEREKQMDRINKQMELVTQLNEAKLAKANVETMAERENFLKQTSILEDTVKILKRQLTESLASEKAFKAQVDMYSSKYGEFTKTFEGYKNDMTKMGKKTFKMEKEMLQWKIKYEKANAMLLELVSEKQVRDEHITKTAKQLFHLQKLCRTLSAEKKAFYSKLIEMNIEVPEVKEIPVETPEVPETAAIEKSSEKLDIMTKNCDELKKNLAHLQGQLKSIADDGEQVSIVGKKGKSKKSKKNAKHAEQNGTIEETPAKVESDVPVPSQSEIPAVESELIAKAEPAVEQEPTIPIETKEPVSEATNEPQIITPVET